MAVDSASSAHQVLPSALAYGGGTRRWFVQLVQEGVAPLRATVLARLAEAGSCGGLDMGPSRIAWATEKEAGEFRFCAEVDRPHQEIRRLQRHLDRQRRANNPQNFDEKGRVRPGKKRWSVSNRQRKTETQLREAQRVEAATRKTAHGRYINFLLSKALHWRDDGVSPRALQRRYGKSVGARAPGRFMTELTRKAERAGGSRTIIDVYRLKTSQYDHATDSFRKKALSERWHEFGDGRGRVHRDIYSAFLALHCEGSTYQPRHLEHRWQALESVLRAAGWYEPSSIEATPSGPRYRGTSPEVRDTRPRNLRKGNCLDLGSGRRSELSEA